MELAVSPEDELSLLSPMVTRDEARLLLMGRLPGVSLLFLRCSRSSSV